MNKEIRRAIESYLQAGCQDTRDVIALFAGKFHTTKQRVSGNISFMCREQRVAIIPNRPHSIMFLNNIANMD